MTTLDKTALREAMLALEGHELQAARDAYAGYLAASKPDDTESSGVQAHSLAVEDAELAQGLEGPLQAAQDAMARLQAIDFGAKDEVAPVPFRVGETLVYTVSWLKIEGGEMTLEDSLGAYERGVGLYRRCQQALEEAELRVRLLSDPAAPERAQPFGALDTDTSDA